LHAARGARTARLGPRCARAARRSAADTVRPPAPVRDPPRGRGLPL